MSPRLNRSSVRAFTLIEILIVVVILGVISSIVTVQVAVAKDDAEISVFAATVKSLARSAERYKFDNGSYPPDGSSGVVPAGFGTYILESAYTNPTPLGGVWDTEANTLGFIFAVGVHFNDGSDPGATTMSQVDALLDDGSLSTGAFREIATNRYYLVCAE